MRHKRRATKMASASQRMLKAGSPLDALNTCKSSSVILSPNHLDGVPSAKRSPPMPQGEASTATRRCVDGGETLSENFLVTPFGRSEKKAWSHERECEQRLRWASPAGSRATLRSLRVGPSLVLGLAMTAQSPERKGFRVGTSPCYEGDSANERSEFPSRNDGRTRE